jgi:MFS family permease
VYIKDKKSNHYKNIAHGFFLAIATTIAEANTILPLIITFFGGKSFLVGLYSALLKGGAVLVQMYAAFHAQSYKLVIPHLKKVFFIRFLSWFLIGISIIVFGKNYPTLTLFLIGIFLFIFSFSAGFGAIYFKELTAKIFTHSFRGKTMSARQFFAGIAALGSGAIAGYIIKNIEAPLNFGILFVVSAFMIAIGFIAFTTIDEPIKENVLVKEDKFSHFLQNAKQILLSDKILQNQIITFLFSYSYLLSLPFIILDAKTKIEIGGSEIGMLITAQMVGATISNILWAKMSGKKLYKLIAQITIILFICGILLALFAANLYIYMLIFFIFGIGIDGSRIASSNLLLMIAPEDKRPIYSALQVNIISFGIFFSIIGGVVLSLTSYNILYIFTLVMLFISLKYSYQLKGIR